MSNVVHVIASVTADPARVDDLRQAMIGLVAAVRPEPGCVKYDLHESIEHPGNFMFYEIWENENYLDAHSHNMTMKYFSDKNGSWISSVAITCYCKIC